MTRNDTLITAVDDLIATLDGLMVLHPCREFADAANLLVKKREALTSDE